MAFKREVLSKALPFPTDIPMHDIWIGNVAAFCGRLHFINDRLLLFRRHDTTASCNGKGSNYSLWQKLSFRWHTLKNIVKLKTGMFRYSCILDRSMLSLCSWLHWVRMPVTHDAAPLTAVK